MMIALARLYVHLTRVDLVEAVVAQPLDQRAAVVRSVV